MLRGERPTVSGQHYSVTDAVNSPAPLPRIPVMVGAPSSAEMDEDLKAMAAAKGWGGDGIDVVKQMQIRGDSDTVGEHLAGIALVSGCRAYRCACRPPRSAPTFAFDSALDRSSRRRAVNETSEQLDGAVHVVACKGVR